MFKILLRFWKAIGAVLALFGVLQLPKDIQDVGGTLAPWREYIAMVDQLTAFKALATILVLWVVWIDVRPLWTKWRDKRWPKEPQSPKLQLFIDTYIDQGRKTHGVDCKVKNIGAVGEVLATMTPLQGVPGGLRLSDLPVCWRHSSARSVRLLPGQSANLQLANLDIDNPTFAIPYAARDGQSTEWLSSPVLKGRRFLGLVQLDIFCDPKNADGAIRDYVVFDMTFGEGGGGSFLVNPFSTREAAHAYISENTPKRLAEDRVLPQPQGTATETLLKSPPG